MNCWHCNHELIWGGDHDISEEDEKYKEVKWKPDMLTIRHYGERDIMEALSYIGVLPE